MKINTLVLITIFLISCSSKNYNSNAKSNNNFIKKYEKVITFYHRNTIYKKCIVNQEVDKIFRKKRMIPVFRMEQSYDLVKNNCYSIWLLKKGNKDFFIYISILNDSIDSFKFYGKNIYKNKNIEMTKSIETNYIEKKLKSINKKYSFDVKNKKGVLNIYKYKLPIKEAMNIKLKIDNMNKEIKTCYLNVESHEQEKSYIFITSNILKVNKLGISIPQDKFVLEAYDNNCSDLLLLVNKLVSLSHKEIYKP